jgi:hypothetical protein
VAASFLVLNAAAWMAFWVWISGGAGRSWGKVRYPGSAAGAYQPAGHLAETVSDSRLT